MKKTKFALAVASSVLLLFLVACSPPREPSAEKMRAEEIEVPAGQQDTLSNPKDVSQPESM
ncbi:MAG TPA: hypothetical protein PKX36_03335 [Candidatus Cloacimonadota bacterium]|nr:hypothetical protein [Candidatus Cloacimonadota bacterium]